MMNSLVMRNMTLETKTFSSMITPIGLGQEMTRLERSIPIIAIGGTS